MATDNNDFTHEFQIYSTDKNAGTMGTGKFLLFDNNINAVKVESVDNIKIGGGSNGRVLATDGEGNLRWISAAAVTGGGVSSYNDLEDLPTLFSGNYNDLTNKPTLLKGDTGDTGPAGAQGPQGERAEEDRLVNGAQEVVLDSNGTLTTPAGLSISKQLDGSAVHVGSTIQSDLNKNLRLQTIGTGSGSLAWQNFEGDANFVTLNYNQSKNIMITVGNAVGEGVLHNWLFASTGNIQLPPGGDIVDIAGNSVLGGGSGATTLSALTDVALEGPVEGSVLTWNDTQGHWENRSLPAATEITNTHPEGPTYSVSVGTDGVVTMVTSRGNLEFGALPEPGGPTHFHIMRPAGQEGSSDLYFGDDYNYVKLPSSSYSQQGVEIGSSLNEGTVSVWRFGTDGDLVLPAGKTIRNTDGDDLLNEATSPQYGYFNELVHSGDNNRINGEAVAMDPDGNSYVSYSYYDDSESKDFGGVMKFDSTGEKLWSVNIASPNGNARYVKIRSLEFSTFGGGSSLVAIGSYYDDAASKDVAFMYLINPATGAVGSMFDTELNASNGMELNDGVFGVDSSNNPYAVIVGSTYDQTVQKTLTPIVGSTVNKVIFSWADINASGLGNRQTIYLNENGNGYAVTINSFDVQANPAGSTEPSWTGISLSVSATESGSYIITRVNGWGAAQYNWTVPQTLTVPGSTLGGVDGVNDMTFDFDRNVFNNDGANIQAAVSNIQGTPVGGGVICLASGSRDWANDIGTPLSFDYQLNNQAYIARLGTTASWTKTIGATSYEELNSVVVDSGGNIYAVGDYDDSSNNRSSLVVKYNINGTRLWAVYIDPDNNTGNELMSVDLLSDGNLITVDEDGAVTKLDSSDGSIIWQVRIIDSPSWDGSFKGTATPDGDYIIVNYEDDDYTMYVLKVSGADGSSVWTKRITRTINGDDGEILAGDDFSAQYIDCNATHVTIAGCSEPDSGDRVGLVFSFPISGENTDGTYGQYVISSASMDWSTESTTSTEATIVDSAMSVTGTPSMPTGTNSNITVTQTMMGGEAVVEPTVITWTNPNNNTWRIENYNGGAAVSYDGGDYDAKWFDIANHTSGNSDFRGAVIQYHAFVQGEGTIIGTIHLGNDDTQEAATHTEHLSGNSNLQFVTLWDCNNDRGQLFFKMTNGWSKNVMIQWTSTVFYGQEWND